MLRLEFRAMGCHMTAVLDAGSHAACLNEVPKWFEAWEQTFSRFRADSELNQINGRAGQWVRISAAMWDVTHLALVAARWTDGLFSPTILNALEATGYDRTFAEIVPSAQPIATQ